MGDETFRQGESRQNRTRDVLAALSGRVRLVEMDGEVQPGIRLVPAPGHTPGNVCVEVESDGERLLFVPDVFAHRLHLERVEWTIIADADPAQAVATRRRLLARLAAEQTPALGYHMAAPGLGRVQAQGGAFVWTTQ